MQDFTHSMSMMLYRALNGVMPRFRAIFSEFGVTETQWRVLRILWERKRIGFRELGELSLIPAPSLVGVIDRLCRDGLVERERSTQDRRQVDILATAAGQALEAQVMPAVSNAYAELSGALDKQTHAHLMAGLSALANLAHAPHQSAAPNPPRTLTGSQ